MTWSAKKIIVILSPALGGTKDLEILRLKPQNDVVGQPHMGVYNLEEVFTPNPRKVARSDEPGELELTIDLRSVAF